MLKLKNGGTEVVTIDHSNKIEIKNGKVNIGSPSDENGTLNVGGVITATQVKNAVYNDY